MKQRPLSCMAATALLLPFCAAQTATHVKKPVKPEPAQQELADYVRGELLALSANDGANDNLEVAFDPATSVLSITQPDGRCDIFLSALDANSVVWDVFDPSETFHTRERVLRVTITSLAGRKGRTCYDAHNEIDPGVAPNRARLVFSLSMTDVRPNFTQTMGKSLKKLVVLAGGSPDKKLF